MSQPANTFSNIQERLFYRNFLQHHKCNCPICERIKNYVAAMLRNDGTGPVLLDAEPQRVLDSFKEHGLYAPRPITANLRTVIKILQRLAGQLRSELLSYSLHPIPRGGWALTTFLSYILPEIRLDFEFRQCDPSTTLIIDDINDTGKTLKPLHAQGYKSLVLYQRQDTSSPSTFVGKGLSSEIGYVYFPWERGELKESKENNNGANNE